MTLVTVSDIVFALKISSNRVFFAVLPTFVCSCSRSSVL